MVGSNLALIVLSFLLLTCISLCHSDAVPCPPAPAPAKCPKDTVKFGVCGDWLGLVHEVVGAPPSSGECCTVLKGVAELEAAVCLCTAIKAEVLGALKMEIPVAISLVLNSCGKKVPDGFVC
nr:putative lipid-binding protein At4g00165 [Ipomoea batatas]GMD74251.1 putative lipid-binding protein At4g00165 [Ipomoea batatas]GMD85613.1 putative lipid-binding protein At4g00165 [Ipomoea batatas]GME02163.1 putative lipid-binding protein At4g00165 [Ipomoea batatas]